VFGVPYIVDNVDIKSLGRYAEINNRRVGQYKREDIIEQKRQAKEEGNRLLAQQVGAKPVKHITEKEYFSKYGGEKLNMSKLDVKKYIETGQKS